MAAAPRHRDIPVRQRGMRTHNLGLVLRHVAASAVPISRADVAAATGLTRATVSSIVDQLLVGSLLTEVDLLPKSGAGRPAIGLRPAASGPAGLGLEINVDYLAACVMDLTGAIRHRELRHRDQRADTPGEVLRTVAELADRAVVAANAEGLTVTGAALAVPGLVANGIVRYAPNLGWRDVDARAAVVDRVPGGWLEVDNEANLAALGELHAMPEDARASFLYISGEIGIGSGIVLDGRLYRGARGFGGELGHVTIRPDGPRCSCGSRGCLETFANQDTVLRNAGEDSVRDLVASARAGATAGLRALADAGSALGVAAAGVVNLLDMETVVLGGSYAPLAPWLCGPVNREISSRVLAARWAPVTVRASVLGESATVVGAAGSIVRAILDAPQRCLDPA